jgi:hypothetical protein
MSEQYKQYIDKLCEEADKGNIKAAQELVDEADKWSAKIKELDNKRKKDKSNE